jgi:hypothetical protein
MGPRQANRYVMGWERIDGTIEASGVGGVPSVR